MFRGLNPQSPPQGLQMQWQPNIGGEAEAGNSIQGFGSAAEALQNWLALRRKRGGVGSASADLITMPSNKISDVPMQQPQNIA